MITFKQLADGIPPDIEVTTDDRNAELIAMTSAFEEYERETGEVLIAASHLDQASMEDAELTFVIPGDEAGQVAECFDASDDARHTVPLQDWLDEQNKKALERAEAIAKAPGGDDE